MQNLPKPIRLLAPLAALLAAVVVISGCGTSNGDIARGRVLFTKNCGTCHVMAQAGTSGTIGPNLDDAFSAARESGGFDASTVEGIVEAQVESPRPGNGNPMTTMPPHIVEGTDLDDVAAYVGKYAGVPGAAPPEVEGGPGAQVFANNGCGGCHTLAAAHSTGNVGPVLDDAKPDYRLATSRVTNGKGVMPSFKGQLSDQEIANVAAFVVTSTGGTAP